MPWLSATVQTEELNAPALSEILLELGAVAVSVDDAAAARGGPPTIEETGRQASLWRANRLSVLLDIDTDVAKLLRTACGILDVDPPPTFTTETLADQDWVRAGQDALEPIALRDDLYLVPSWREPPDPQAINVVLDPGLAFGSGHHATTRMCLEWLATALPVGATVLDYGSGSGVLAIVAMKLGAASALGVDIDPVAVDVARENAARNDVAAEFVLAADAPLAPVDVVVANILATPLLDLADRLAAATRPGGSIVLSGILRDQEAALRQAYAEQFAMEAARYDDDWVCLVGSKLAIATGIPDKGGTPQ